MTYYKIVRRFYTSSSRAEAGHHYKEFEHAFTPLTLHEAQVIKSKLYTPKDAIDHIEII